MVWKTGVDDHGLEGEARARTGVDSSEGGSAVAAEPRNIDGVARELSQSRTSRHAGITSDVLSRSKFAQIRNHDTIFHARSPVNTVANSSFAARGRKSAVVASLPSTLFHHITWRVKGDSSQRIDRGAD